MTTADTIARLAAAYRAARDASRAAQRASSVALDALYLTLPTPSEDVFAAARLAAGLPTAAEESALWERADTLGRQLGALLRRIARANNVALPAGVSDRELADLHIG